MANAMNAATERAIRSIKEKATISLGGMGPLQDCRYPQKCRLRLQLPCSIRLREIWTESSPVGSRSIFDLVCGQVSNCPFDKGEPPFASDGDVEWSAAKGSIRTVEKCERPIASMQLLECNLGDLALPLCAFDRKPHGAVPLAESKHLRLVSRREDSARHARIPNDVSGEVKGGFFDRQSWSHIEAAPAPLVR